MTNVAREQSAAASDAPDRPAVRLNDLTVTDAELDAAVSRAAGLLRTHGIKPGDRVGVQLPYVVYFPIAYWAVLRIGEVVVPMNPLPVTRVERRHARGLRQAVALEDRDAERLVEAVARSSCRATGTAPTPPIPR